MDVKEKTQIILNSKDDTTHEVEQIIKELEAIKKEWFEALSDLNEQRIKYRELNKELLEMRNEIVKLKNFL